MTAAFVIGIDGGGTGCRVLIKDMRTGRSAMAEGGPSNVATDFDAAVANLTAALENAVAAFGLTIGDLTGAAAHIGVAGVFEDNIKARLKDAFPFQTVTVTDDRAGAVEGFLGGQDGYLVAAGTGMIIAASRDGIAKFVGGRGFYVSDHGSGAWIGRLALDLTLQSIDGLQPQSNLSRALVKEFEDDPGQIVSFSLTAGPSDYAKLAPKVVEAAQSGDRHGVAILEAGADHITKAIKVLGCTAGDRLCLAGGVGPHYVAYLDPGLTAGLAIPVGSAPDGAVRLAERLHAKT